MPPRLRRVLGSVELSGFTRRKKPVQLTVGELASPAWRETTGELISTDPAESLLEKVIRAVELAYLDNPDALDIPFLECPLDRFDYALGLPFETRTWDFLWNCGVKSDLDVMVMVTGTFRELRDRLGDMRATLDVAVTSALWIVESGSGQYGFARVQQPQSVAEAGELVRKRAFRSCGFSPASHLYTKKFANVMGMRWGVGITRKWTLEECGRATDLTRERIRQIEKSIMWLPAQRMWGRPEVLESMYVQLLHHEVQEVTVLSTGDSMARQEAVSVLTSYGYPEADFEGPWTLADELELNGIRWADVNRVAYKESERLGLLTLSELRHHIADAFPLLMGEMFEDVIAELVQLADLPHGYVYVEQNGTSYLKSWLTKLLSVLGPQRTDEVYRAAERFCKVRIPRLVFPPRSVIENYLDRAVEFWTADGLVGLEKPAGQELEGVERWVREQIEQCTGHVIHRTELWERARAAGVRLGTLNVYANYSLMFKPCGHGCVTLTGLLPAEIALELAVMRASAIRVATERLGVRVIDGVVVVEVNVGNDLLDSGVLGSSREMREMLKGRRFRVFALENQHGNSSWSGNVLTGFVQSLQALQAQPGDRVLFSFSLDENEVVLQLASE